MPPTTSQSVVVDDEALDDVETGAAVVVVVSTVASTGVNGVVSVEAFPVAVVSVVWNVGRVDERAATVPNVVVGAVLLVAEQADITRPSDIALAMKIFDFGTGTPRENQQKLPYAAVGA